jgi:hypothetical protein
MKANPTPVLPDVGSMIVVFPGMINPYFSPSSINEKAKRSFTEQQGSINSIFAAIKAWQSLPTFFRYTIGVLPITSWIPSYILGACSIVIYIIIKKYLYITKKNI